MTLAKAYIVETVAEQIGYTKNRSSEIIVNDRLNRASGDRRNGAISKGPKTISNSPFKLAFFTSFLG